MKLRLIAPLLAVLYFAISASAQYQKQIDPDWLKPFPPFKIAGNLYSVGSAELDSYLVATPEGLILINSNLTESVPAIQKNIEKLGYRFSDVKILLISHAHFDHCAGSALVKKLTGAKYFVMDADVPAVESGGARDFYYASRQDLHYPPAKVDRTLHDNDTVKLGGTVLTAHRTGGHTPGTTTWTLDVIDNGRTLHAVIVGSPSVIPGYKLVHNPTYPQIAEDYKHQFEVLNALPCDLFLGAHGQFFDMEEKYARLKAGDKAAFIDPAGYKAFVADRKSVFENELARQQAAPPKSRPLQ
jgi:metallo-beta-lactamase class B